KLNVIPNWKTKQMIFSYFYKGMKYSKFKKAGVRFSNKIEGFIRKDILQELQTHQKNGTKIYVISASIEDWILPFCKKHNIDNIIATGAETDEKGLLTGKFKTMNCYGKEKLRRFQAHEPFRENYYLYVYGDSDGDNELFQYSDEAINVK
ncbi:MAG: HAD-IB family phosphatase, partial [Prevotellaceae bacterium]|nr:HAD-IB family phosphatase [Candidatus Colivivens equi]